MAEKFLIRTFGCQMNEHDSELLAGLFVEEGMEATDDVEEADLVILNTCCIRENADNKLYGHLGHLKSIRDRRPEMRIAVGGCLAQKDRDLVRRRAGHVDVVFGTHNLARAPELLRRSAVEGPLVEVLDEPLSNGGSSSEDPRSTGGSGGHPGQKVALSAVRDVPYSAWVTIQAGCDNSCSFCIVPSVRGKEVSRSPEELIGEVEALASRGVTEVTLLGQNVNSYGRDITRRRPLFADLLRSIGEVEGIRRVRFTSPHPKDLRSETIAAMAETEAVCEQLHLPLQSGSDRTLSEMRRGYTAERYMRRLAEARSAISDLAVTTDIIVGFPGETEEDFVRTLEVVSAAEYDSAFTFIFSPRPGTRASDFEDRFVPEEVISERFERLRVVVERSALARHRARIGKVEEVLVEGISRRDSTAITGRTRQGKLVHFPVPPDGSAGPDGSPESSMGPSVASPGSYATVLITAAAPHHLLGDLISVTSPPRHRVRTPIPLSVR